MNKTVTPSKILIPNGIDLKKWATIACDQFTSEKHYWEQLEEYVGNEPSCLHITLPEVYLQADNSERIKSIHDKMNEYLSSEFLQTEREGYVLVIRKTPFGATRIGVVVAINLDDYSFDGAENASIRSTEDTVITRIPPRVEIRQDAPLETPHVMLLCNDVNNSVIEKLYEDREQYEKLYSFDLNMHGGFIEGYFIPASVDLNSQFESIKTGDLMFAVGDGNHSLATAKTCWENIKKTLKDGETSSAQYALCEVVNIHSEGITFEPIHRLVTGIDTEKFIDGLRNCIDGKGNVGLVTSSMDKSINAPESTVECYKKVQGYIDEYLAKNGGEVDYIHGLKSINDLSCQAKTVGIIMPKLGKDELFKDISQNMVYPRKTFSMGEAQEKRYYLETRKIK